MIGFFESKLQRLSADSRAKYKRVLSAFDVYLIGHSLTLKNLTPRIVEDWVYDLLRKEKPKSTIVRHLNVLASVLRGDTGGNLADAARRARQLARLFEGSTVIPAPLVKESVVEASITILRSYLKGTGEADAAGDLLTVAILGGCIPVSQLIQMRKDSVDEFSGRIKEVLARNESSKRDYVFDLRQSYRTPRQILQFLSDTLTSKFSGIAAGEELDIDQLVRSLWVAIAIRCGALPSEALGCVDGARYAEAYFLTPEPQDSETRLRWTKAVAGMIGRSTSHWYAMHLRRGVTFDQLQKEIADSLRPAPTLFYPCREIFRSVRGAKIIDQQPYISSTVFFRTDPSSVMPMFEKIGDIAWCYRLSNTPGAPYAIIPTREMQRFQTAIGQFTPDTELHPLGTLALRPGDEVVLLMADFYNQPARVTRLLSTPTGRTIYRVAFTTASGFEWAVDAAPSQLHQS